MIGIHVASDINIMARNRFKQQYNQMYHIWHSESQGF